MPETRHFQSRGRGDRTPVNGFGDRRTTAVLFPYVITDELYCSTLHMGLASENLKFFEVFVKLIQFGGKVLLMLTKND